MNGLDQFARQQYLNIETFRKSGLGVKTPVWFVQDGDSMFIRTIADSGKVKRIHHNKLVNIAPCKMDGTITGSWLPAVVQELKDEDSGRKIDHLLDKKYGLMKKLFGLASNLQHRKYTVLEVKITI